MEVVEARRKSCPFIPHHPSCRGNILLHQFQCILGSYCFDLFLRLGASLLLGLLWFPTSDCCLDSCMFRHPAALRLLWFPTSDCCLDSKFLVCLDIPLLLRLLWFPTSLCCLDSCMFRQPAALRLLWFPTSDCRLDSCMFRHPAALRVIVVSHFRLLFGFLYV